MAVQEVLPLMVLVEESEQQLVFRFRGLKWALTTLAGGSALVGMTMWYHLNPQVAFWPAWILYGLAVLLFYASVYSFHAQQYLVITGSGMLRFHKRNLYGQTDWERSGKQFREIQVFQGRASRGSGRAQNWSIVLTADDAPQLWLGENEFGAWTQERALALAAKVARMTGIEVVADGVEE